MYAEVIKTSYKIYIIVTNQWGGTEHLTVKDLENGKTQNYKSIYAETTKGKNIPSSKSVPVPFLPQCITLGSS